MSTSFRIRVDGEPVQISLFSLDEYELAGGVYDDSGNGGEHVAQGTVDEIISGLDWDSRRQAYRVNEYGASIGCGDLGALLDVQQKFDLFHEADQITGRQEFVCAAAVAHNNTGLPDNDLLELAGVARADYWLDSATDYFLLRSFPDEAPLEARMGLAPDAGLTDLPSDCPHGAEDGNCQQCTQEAYEATGVVA